MCIGTPSLTVLVVVAVALLWICTSVKTAAMTTSSTSPVASSSSSSSSSSSDIADVFNDEGVCTTRYLNSGTKAADLGNVVAIATIVELRRPQGKGCGHVSTLGLQIAAGLLWAVRRLNGDGQGPGVESFIPGVRIELHVYDDCSHELLAARHVGELLSSHPHFNCTPSSPPIAGVLGTTTSQTTSRVASLLSNTKIPQFGISATVSVLSNKVTYPTFFRTVPSDLTQSKVLVELVQKLQWTYVVGIYTRDNYGIEGFQEFKRLAGKVGVCVFKEAGFRHSDREVEKAMERFVRELLIEVGSTRFSSLGVVYFGHDTEADILFQMIEDRRSRWHDRDKLASLHWLFSDGVGTSSSIAAKAAPYKSYPISISMATHDLPDVKEHFFSLLDQPDQLGPYWKDLVTEYLHQQLGCFHPTSPVQNCQLRDKIGNNDYLPAALHSLYSLAGMLKAAREKACSGPGLCGNMSTVLEEGLLSAEQPQPTDYSQAFFSPNQIPNSFAGRRTVVDEYGDFLPANSPLYFINSVSDKRWTKIGEYSNGSLTLDDQSGLASVKRSECGTNCLTCRPYDGIRFAYQPGEVIILGLYSVSTPRASNSFSCGDYRNQSSSVVSLLAFLRAVDHMSVAGTKFGALVLDDCYNQLTVSSLLTDLFSGKVTLTDPVSGQTIEMSRVVAVVGSQSSSVTLSALSLLSPLHIPCVSASATSSDLDDRLRYPFFLRPVPSDSLQAQALLHLVLHLNVSHVGGLYQNNNYGLRGMQHFVRLAKQAGVCVEKTVAVDGDTSEVTLLSHLRAIRNQDAAVVVVFVVENTAIRLLDAAQDAKLNLIFLASEAWTVSRETLKGQRGMTARGSVVLTVDTNRETGDIQMAEYLSGLTASDPSTTHLPWIRDFWENEKQCNLPGGFTNAYQTMCDHDMRLGDDLAGQLADDQKVVHTINAVGSIIAAFNRQCLQHSDPPTCMKTLPAKAVTDAIKDIQLPDQNKRLFRPYLDNGNGNVGFKVNNVQKMPGGQYQYVQVGSFQPEGRLDLEQDVVMYDLVGQPIPWLTSSCRFKPQCDSVCGKGTSTLEPPIRLTPATKRSEEAGVGVGWVVAVCVLAALSVILLSLLLALFCCARRHGRIPCVGVVRKNSLNCGSSGVDIGMGRLPRSAHPSSPLPPTPQSTPAQQYNLPHDISSDLSTSRSSAGSHRAAGNGLGVSHYDYSHGEGLQRRPRGQKLRQGRYQTREQSPRQARTIRQHSEQSSSLGVSAASKARPRARSEPQTDRPLMIVGVGGGGGKGQQGWSSSSPASPPSARPRSRSHDGSFRSRLGALSDDDQHILMKYLFAGHQHNTSPQQPSVITPPQAQTGSAATPAQRPTFFLSSKDRQASKDDLSALVPNIVFQNAPSFCSSSTSLGSPSNYDPSLHYIHAVAAERDLYLEVLPDSSQQLSPHLPSAIVPAVHPTSLPASTTATTTASQDTWPLAVGVISKSATSPVSPLTSVPGSTGSESSGAVFVSPQREYPLSAFALLPNTQYVINTNSRSSVPHTLQHFPVQPGATVTSPTVSLNAPNSPTISPTVSLNAPTISPVVSPNAPNALTISPTVSPNAPNSPTISPTVSPNSPTISPTVSPKAPTISPTGSPNAPTISPTGSPIVPYALATSPAVSPGAPNTLAISPAVSPDALAISPSVTPRAPTMSPTVSPRAPTIIATVSPNEQPTRVLSPHRLQQLILRRSKSPLSSASDQNAQSNKLGVDPVGAVLKDNAGSVFWTPDPVVPSQQSSHTFLPSTNYPVSPPLPDKAGTPQQLCQCPAETQKTDRHGQGSFDSMSCSKSWKENWLKKADRFGGRSYSDSSLDTGQHSLVANSLTPTTKSRTPKMGVDSLSVQRKPVENTQTLNNQNAQSSVAFPGRNFDTIKTAQLTVPKMIALSQSPESSVDSRTKREVRSGEESVPYIQAYQLVPSPSPCKAQVIPDTSGGSGGSNHTSGDSGTGEDLTSDYQPSEAVCV